jgi:hypothetical protein
VEIHPFSCHDLFFTVPFPKSSETLEKKLKKYKLALRSKLRDLVNDHFYLKERPTNIFTNTANRRSRRKSEQQVVRNVQTDKLF